MVRFFREYTADAFRLFLLFFARHVTVQHPETIQQQSRPGNLTFPHYLEALALKYIYIYIQRACKVWFVFTENPYTADVNAVSRFILSILTIFNPVCVIQEEAFFSPQNEIPALRPVTVSNQSPCRDHTLTTATKFVHFTKYFCRR